MTAMGEISTDCQYRIQDTRVATPLSIIEQDIPFQVVAQPFI